MNRGEIFTLVIEEISGDTIDYNNFTKAIINTLHQLNIAEVQCYSSTDEIIFKREGHKSGSVRRIIDFEINEVFERPRVKESIDELIAYYALHDTIKVEMSWAYSPSTLLLIGRKNT